MKKIAIFSAIAALAGLTHAGTTLEQRLEAVNKLKNKYPCTNFHHEVDQDLCVIYLDVLSREKASTLSDADWRVQIREMQERLEDWKIDAARIRNGLQPKLGMSKAYIYKHVLGAPRSINDSLSASGQTSQWVYETDDGTLYLYFDNKEKLRSMQRSR